MKGSKPFPLVGLGLIVCALLMSGCGGKVPQNGPSALNIATQTPAQGAEGDPYSQELSAYGGVSPYTWSVDSGALPPGFSLNSSSGVLGGTAPAGSAGTYNFTVRVTDSQSPVKAYQTASLSITINPALSFPTTPPLANAVIAVPFSSSVMASGGLAPLQILRLHLFSRSRQFTLARWLDVESRRHH